MCVRRSSSFASPLLRRPRLTFNMQPQQLDDADPAYDTIRPPLSSIPHFIIPPPPQAFPQDTLSFQSTIPTDASVPRQPPLLDVSLKLTVSPSLFFRIIPLLHPYLKAANPTIDALHAPTHRITIENTQLNRSLLHHALYGMLILAPPKPPPLLSNVIAANFQALSLILRRVPAFVISLEPSPYFGVAGLEARIVLPPTGPPTTSPPSYHLLAISSPDIHIPNLQLLLKHICPNFSQRLLGVIAHLTPQQHNSPLGVTASRTIAHFLRLAPPGPFITPDSVLTPPPLTPPKLAALSQHQLIALVDEYRPRLDHMWPAQVFKRLISDAERLRSDQTSPQAGGEGMLEHAWALVAQQYPNLCTFSAVLATAFAYKPPVRTKVHITCHDSTPHTFAAEFVLHARQFVLLRKTLTT